MRSLTMEWGTSEASRKRVSIWGLRRPLRIKKMTSKNASKLILPGVGAFDDAMKNLNRHGLVDTIREETQKGKYFLGICLGMQLLFDKSYENGEFGGLGLVKGEVIPFDVPGLKVPHMGWNKLVIKDNPLFSNEEKRPVRIFRAFVPRVVRSGTKTSSRKANTGICSARR